MSKDDQESPLNKAWELCEEVHPNANRQEATEFFSDLLYKIIPEEFSLSGEGFTLDAILSALNFICETDPEMAEKMEEQLEEIRNGDDDPDEDEDFEEDE